MTAFLPPAGFTDDELFPSGQATAPYIQNRWLASGGFASKFDGAMEARAELLARTDGIWALVTDALHWTYDGQFQRPTVADGVHSRQETVALPGGQTIRVLYFSNEGLIPGARRWTLEIWHLGEPSGAESPNRPESLAVRIHNGRLVYAQEDYDTWNNSFVGALRSRYEHRAKLGLNAL